MILDKMTVAHTQEPHAPVVNVRNFNHHQAARLKETHQFFQVGARRGEMFENLEGCDDIKEGSRVSIGAENICFDLGMEFCPGINGMRRQGLQTINLPA